jgi:AcrR family transcriptional regulator
VSSQVSTPPRRHLNARQAETLGKIFAAGEEVLEEVGHDALTIRMVALRAGVSTATAYTYVASKDHLFAELFVKLLRDDPGPELTGRARAARLEQTVRHLADLLAGAPGLAAAANKSLLGNDPEVARLRVEIGFILVGHFRTALGEVSDDVVDAVTFAFSGALLQAGMELITFDELGDVLARVVAVILKGYR